MAAAGVDRVHVARFDARFASLSAVDFIEKVLVRGLGTRSLAVGRDFRFGHGRAGDYAALEAAAGRHDFRLESVPDVTLDGERVSSSAVRAALQAGDPPRAARPPGPTFNHSGRAPRREELRRRPGFSPAHN